MELLEVKEWLSLNRMIYKIYGDEDLTKMREDFLQHLKMFIDFDSAYFYLSNAKEEFLFDSPCTYNYKADEYLDFSSDIQLSEIIKNKHTIIFREKGIKKDSKMYNGMHLVIAMDKKILGILTLLRNTRNENFDMNDVLTLDWFKEHLALRLDKECKHNDEIKIEETSYEIVAKQYDLTKKERIVVEMLSNGESTEQISSKLDVSVNTIKKHTMNIYRKLGINKRIQLFQMFSQMAG